MRGRTLTFGKIKRIMNLHFSGMGVMAIAHSAEVSRHTVTEVIRVCTGAGLTAGEGVTVIAPEMQKEIARRLYRGVCDFTVLDEVTPIPLQRNGNHTDPVDYARYLAMADEQHLRMGECYLLYLEECNVKNARPVGKSAFYNGIRNLRLKIADGKDRLAYMTRDYQYGVETQIDWCGDRVELTLNGRIAGCSIFVAVWAASGMAFACAVPDQTTASTVEALNAFWRFSGVRSRVMVCDNARALITKHVRGEVITNRSFDLYLSAPGVELIAALPYHAQRKNVVEYTVRLIQDRVLKDMENYRHLGLEAFNRKLMLAVNRSINDVGFRQNGTGTPRSGLFAQYEKPAALPLPARLPSYVETVPGVTVPRSYQIKVGNHYYSVPYHYIGEKVDVIVYPHRIEFTDSITGRQIAEHARDDSPGRSITDEHCPEVHRRIRRSQARYQTNEEIIDHAEKMSPEVRRFCEARLARGDTQARRACVRLINLYATYSDKDVFDEAVRTVLRTSDLRTGSVVNACRAIMSDPSVIRRLSSSEAGIYDTLTDDSDQRISDDGGLTNIRHTGDALRQFLSSVPAWDSQLESAESAGSATGEQHSDDGSKENE